MAFALLPVLDQFLIIWIFHNSNKLFLWREFLLSEFDWTESILMAIILFFFQNHCMKSVRIQSFSDPYFPAFGLNTEKYGVSLRIQSECEKIQTRKTPNADTFQTVYCETYKFDLNPQDIGKEFTFF